MSIIAEWIATDDTQFVKVLGENRFEFVEMLNHNDEVHVINHEIIEYTDFTEDDILEYIEPYGYESIEQVKETYGIEYKQVICECIFESLEEARCFDSLSEKDCVNYMEEVFGIKMQQLIESNDMEQNILNLKIGNIHMLGDIWDGNGEIPTESYSYHLNEDQWINYEFEFLNAEDKENIENGSLVRPDALYTLVKLTAIEIL